MTLVPYVADRDFELYLGDVRDVLPKLADGAADACVTSPPYLDARPEYGTLTRREWVEFFRELRRVVTGPALVNVGRLFRDGVELDWWIDVLRVAKLAGWKHLDTSIWIKPNANPIQGPILANSHEYVLVLGDVGTKLNEDAVRTPYAPESLARYERAFAANAGVKGASRPAHRRPQPGIEHDLGARARSFFVAYTGREKGNPHPAPMPVEVAEYLCLLGSWEGQTILDPFAGSGNTAIAARANRRRSIGIELDPRWAALAARRNSQQSLFAAGGTA